MQINICSRCGAQESTGVAVGWYTYSGKSMLLCGMCAKEMRLLEKNMRKVEREARDESMMCAGDIDNRTVYGKNMEDNNFKTPPPFVRCNCTYGRYSQHVKSAPGSALDGAEYEITKPCGVCAGSPLPGWIPQFYTPEQYRDWIRRENDLPDYELPPDTKIYVRSKEGARNWYLTGTMWEYTDGNRFDPRYNWVVVDTIAGRPPEDWKP